MSNTLASPECVGRFSNCPDMTTFYELIRVGLEKQIYPDPLIEKKKFHKTPEPRVLSPKLSACCNAQNCAKYFIFNCRWLYCTLLLKNLLNDLWRHKSPLNSLVAVCTVYYARTRFLPHATIKTAQSNDKEIDLLVIEWWETWFSNSLKKKKKLVFLTV